MPANRFEDDVHEDKCPLSQELTAKVDALRKQLAKKNANMVEVSCSRCKAAKLLVSKSAAENKSVALQCQLCADSADSAKRPYQGEIRKPIAGYCAAIEDPQRIHAAASGIGKKFTAPTEKKKPNKGKPNRDCFQHIFCKK